MLNYAEGGDMDGLLAEGNIIVLSMEMCVCFHLSSAASPVLLCKEADDENSIEMMTFQRGPMLIFYSPAP
jgi:hypothetical protein